MQSYEDLEQLWNASHEFPEENKMVAVSSGTSALHIALETLKLPSGSVVLIPNYTMVACARAVTLAGLSVRTVDCNAYDFNMSLDSLLNSDLTNVKAIMFVPVYGYSIPEEYYYWANQRGLYIIEDLAEAHGFRPYKLSYAACWSFYRNKIVAGEEGGAIWFADSNSAAHARQLRSVGFTEAHDYLHVPRGINARMSNAHAQLILKSIDSYGYNLNLRHEYVKYYLTSLKFLIEAHFVSARAPTSPWFLPIEIIAVNVDEVYSELRLRVPGVRLGFKPINQQPEYFDASYTQSNASRHASRVLLLPLNPGTKPKEVVDSLLHVLRYLSTSR